jgi:hypothetical protein
LEWVREPLESRSEALAHARAQPERELAADGLHERRLSDGSLSLSPTALSLSSGSLSYTHALSNGSLDPPGIPWRT